MQNDLLLSLLFLEIYDNSSVYILFSSYLIFYFIVSVIRHIKNDKKKK